MLPKSRILCFSSLYWISGISVLITSTLSKCIRIITTDDFTPELMLNAIRKYNVTHIITPPCQLSAVLKCPLLLNDTNNTLLSSIKAWVCGGSHLPVNHIEKIKQFLPNGQLLIIYGLTENTGGLSIGFPYIKPNSVGQLVVGVQVKIVDDNGNRVGVGANGEICVYSKYQFTGYYGNSAASRLAFDQDGFIKSGDIGHFDEDGDLFLVDRKKDIFKYKNRPITPSEIENIILQHDGVQMVSVVSVPDSDCNDLPAAAIVKYPNSSIAASEIYEMIKNQLNDAKQLRGGIYFIDSMPMTPSGKIMRREVQKIVFKLHKKASSSFDARSLTKGKL